MANTAAPEATTSAVSAAAPDRAAGGGSDQPPGTMTRATEATDSALERYQRPALLVMKALVLVPIVAYLYDPSAPHALPIRSTKSAWFAAFAIWALATAPVRLYERFIRTRGPALWIEYVVNLHRLGVDGRRYLPEPPKLSEYHHLWEEDLGREPDPSEAAAPRRLDPSAGHNLYRAKFDAYFGKEVSLATMAQPDAAPPGAGTAGDLAAAAGPERSGQGLRALGRGLRRMTELRSPFALGMGSLAPVVVASLVFSAGWVATVLVLTGASDGTDVGTMLVFAFMGAYVFNLQALVRRYYQLDLRPSAYTSALVRTITAVIMARVLYEVPSLRSAEVAFIAGVFPIAALESVRSTVFRVLRATHISSGALDDQYPLSELQGMNVWYEERLREEGIEDMEDLVTAPIVDILLHTRVPAHRLVDWIDQAILLLRLEPQPSKLDPRPARGEDDGRATAMRDRLQSHGIHRATDLLVAFGAYRPVDDQAVASSRPGGGGQLGSRWPWAAPAGAGHLLPSTAGSPGGGRPFPRVGWEPDREAVQLASALTEGSQWRPAHLIALVRIVVNDTALAPILNWRSWGARVQAECAYGISGSSPVDAR